MYFITHLHLHLMAADYVQAAAATMNPATQKPRSQQF